MEAGKPEVAYAWLQRALRADPTDLTIARDLSRIAERIGSWGEYVRLGEVCADAFASYDPLAAAARFRHFAEVLRDRLTDTERAAVMLEKALSLTPDDADARRDLLGLWSARPETAQRALDGWLDTVRLEPGRRARARLALRDLPRGRPRPRRRGRTRSCWSAPASPRRWRAFVNPALASAPALKLASAIPEELRERVAVPGATGALARAPLAPRPVPRAALPGRPRAPRRGALGSARPAARPGAPHRAGGGGARLLGPSVRRLPHRRSAGVELALENTQPPSLVAGAEVAFLAEGSRPSLAPRAFDLLARGWALAGKFAPKDVAILWSWRAASSARRSRRRGSRRSAPTAFLAALGKTVPPTVRERALRLAAAAGRGVRHASSRAASPPPCAAPPTAWRCSTRAIPGAALRALAALEPAPARSRTSTPSRRSPVPDLRDLALFALSDPFVELRVSVTS